MIPACGKTDVLARLPPGARVLVVRLRSMGDCVLTTPALSILRETRPDIRLGVAVEPRFAPIFEGNPDIDELLPPTVAATVRWRPRLCLNLHGGPRSMALTALSGAAIRAGFDHYCCSWLYNVRIPAAQEILRVERKVHTAEHLASAIFHLGAPVREIPPAKLSAEPHCTSHPYAVLHPAASAPEKTWPSDRFVVIAEHLRSQLDLEPVFVAGAGDDLRPFAPWRCLAGAPLAAVKSLLAGASLFVGNDSGPAHVAAAFGVPVVVLFGDSDPEIWGPWQTASEALVEASIQQIEAAQVLAALERVRVKV